MLNDVNTALVKSDVERIFSRGVRAGNRSKRECKIQDTIECRDKRLCTPTLCEIEIEACSSPYHGCGNAVNTEVRGIRCCLSELKKGSFKNSVNKEIYIQRILVSEQLTR